MGLLSELEFHYSLYFHGFNLIEIEWGCCFYLNSRMLFHIDVCCSSVFLGFVLESLEVFYIDKG